MPVRLAVIGGSGVRGRRLLADPVPAKVETPFGPPASDPLVGLVGSVRVAFLARHGEGHAIPPHRVNHRANLWALKELGVRRVLGASSVGSLRRDWKPGEVVIPHDYLSLWEVPTFHDERPVHATPALDERMRRTVLAAAKSVGIRARPQGVYAQTRGPRLETKAEIRLLKDYADVVGMTMASEATLAAELGFAYASVCTIDNYAHGLTDRPLRFTEIRKVQRSTAKVLEILLPAALARLGSRRGNV